MAKLQSFLVFLNKRLAEAVVDIFGAVEKTVLEFQEENDRIQGILQKRPEIRLCKSDSMKFCVSEEEVPPEQQPCEAEWSPSLGQEDPEATQIKKEQEELRTSQEEEQLQGPLDTNDSILTFPCVKSECDQEDLLHKAILAEYPTLSQLKRSKLQMFHVFLKDFFMVSAAVKVFGAVEKTIAECQEENDRLRRLLGTTPETEEVPPEQQPCEAEWSPSLGQEDPEPTLIKEEQEELRIDQEEEHFQGLQPDIIEFIFPRLHAVLSLKRRFPLSSSTVSRRGAPVWGRRIQSPHRLKRNRRNTGSIRR
ncbi:hypothetical protein UPYG_G00001020 [Umbra pygmaea]|uniref:Uncharacterized protein n=1 Tax=Umbra pygmaea TaxID=75934 RepID=A0ABD0Y5K4_UMBPY